MEFYNPNKLLSLKDLDGCDPELFFCVGNRTAGKTFAFKKLMVQRFIRKKEKFVIFVRFIDDVPNTAETFWADIGPLKFPKRELTQKPLLHGKCASLLLDGEECGYVIPLNDPQRIKIASARFADAACGFIDEFASETGKYVPGEIQKFNSIRLSIARGGSEGKHTRYFPVYLCSNKVSVFNPYFDYWHIASRLDNRSKFIRGNHWVLEQTFNEEAAAAIRAQFSSMSDAELDYAAGQEFLLDNHKFVEDIPGQKVPLMRFEYNDCFFTVWQAFSGKIVVNEKTATGVPVVAFDPNTHEEGKLLMNSKAGIIKQLRKTYEQRGVWFCNQRAKRAFLDICGMI